MRRWNGWGDEAVGFALAPRAAALLESALGPGRPRPDAPLETVLAAAAPSRLPAHPLLGEDAFLRLQHARGQSLPDWIALRSGRPGALPDAVAFPQRGEEVRELMRLAREWGARLIPYGGGTSVVGHVNVADADVPTVTVSLSRLGGLRALDERSLLASFGAGTTGPDLEAQLRMRGYTLGHFPQSFEYSTLGGWVATRSSGQESLGYGRIERLFAGGRLEAPGGTLELPALPASAAGPDLRQLVLGSEGRLGILTDVTVRVRERPAHHEVRSVFFPRWEPALEAVRALGQSGLPLGMLRLSGPGETEVALALSSQPGLVRALERYLGWRGAGEQRCLLLVGLMGRPGRVRASWREARALCRDAGGIPAAGTVLGAHWRRGRFQAPYLRNTLWERGYAVDTLETAAPWSGLDRLREAVERSLRTGLQAEGEPVHVFTHVSHVYPDGASLYTTYLFRLADPEQDLRRWRALKEAASRAIVASGGTISHHHGVGLDHRPHLEAEKGALGLAALGEVCRRFDPGALMNPGKLVA